MNQLTKNLKKRVMYMENKSTGEARIGWVSFSKTGLSIYYKDKTFKRLKTRGVLGNYYCEETDDEYWISGIKKRGSNALYEPITLHIDEDALQEYKKIKNIK
jgi:hypothetical protein